MQATYTTALEATLKWEGGWANHPADPGGATYRGVTQRVYDGWRRRQGRPTRSVRAMTEAEMQAIYRLQYWDVVKGDELPAGPDAATFDAGVNSGPVRAARWLQKALRVAADGQVGVVTLTAASRHPDKADLVKALCRLRLSFVQGLKTWRSFGRGWTRRIAAIEALGVRLALAASGRTAPQIRAAAEDEAKAATAAKKRSDAGAVAAGGGGGGAATQVEPAAADLTVSLILAGLVVAAIAVCILLVWRSRVEKARAAAYAQLAKEV